MFYGNLLQKNRAPGLPKSFDFGQGIILNASSTPQYGTVSSLSGVAIPSNWTFIACFRLLYPTAMVSISTINIGLFSSYSGTDIFAICLGKSTTNNNLTTQLVLLNPSQGLTIANPAVAPPANMDINLSTKIFFIAMSYNSSLSELKFYFQGILLDTITVASNKFPANFQTNNEIGRHFGDNNRLLKAVKGETRFIPSTLTAAQISKYYNDAKGNNNLDSLSHVFGYRFEGNGNDFSGNSRNLTLIGSPTYENFC